MLWIGEVGETNGDKVWLCDVQLEDGLDGTFTAPLQNTTVKYLFVNKIEMQITSLLIHIYT